MKSKLQIQIESGVELPAGHRWLTSKQEQLRQILQGMKVKESFIYPDNHDPYRAAKDCGVKIATRKVDGQGFRVWRVA
jgi:hypothetical protein